MGFLDELEKLINEHGSAAILKERIALANDKYAALEEKIGALRAENDILRSENGKLVAQVHELELLNAEAQKVSSLTLKYGIYWDARGNSFCPKCKAPMFQVAWATYVNQQVHGLKCACTDKPFILMESGKPIQAQEAMRRMANAC
jgi:hypothetical protein